MKNVTLLGAAIAVAASLTPVAGHAQDAAAAGGTSGACFDQGLYTNGAVVDYDTKFSGDGAPPPVRTVTTVKAAAQFEGASATPVVTETFNDEGKSQGVVTSYYNFEPGFLLILGSEATDVKTTFDPAGRQPIDQNKGDTYKQKYEMTTDAEDVGTQTVSRQASWKFEGVEKLKLKLGKFKVCKITAKFTDKFGTFSTTTKLTTYVAASGKYRGFTLRTKTSTKLLTGQTLTTTADVVKFRKFKPK